MNFLSLAFYAFIPIFLIIYYVVPTKYRYVVIAIGSFLFYGFADVRMLLVLLIIIIITYIGGLVLESKKTKCVYATFFILTIMVLLIFKYTNFIIQNINIVFSKLHLGNNEIEQMNLILPVGLSFIVFQACTYLGDVYKANINAERNPIRYAAFIAFFPTVLAGPIQKARQLLPQITTPLPFDAQRAKKGTILFVWGLFEKVMVANKLMVIVNTVYGDYENYNSAYYIIAGICFSLYIYADFSAISDMARGISMIMGIYVGKNFNNPYLSCTTSEFWNRWHVSLNEWFIEYLYIPLGGNRKGKIRKYLNIMIVFFASGLWHGANYHFVIWGILNGILVVIGRVLKPIKNRIYTRLKVDETLESVVLVKRAIVFWLITLTWVFFNNGVSQSMYLVKNMIFFNFINFFDQQLLCISGTSLATFITLITVTVFVIVQVKRQNERAEYVRFSRQPMLFQTILIAIMICAIIFTVCLTDANVNTDFIYYQF